MDPKARRLDQLGMRYWREGEDRQLGEIIVKESLSSSLSSLFVAARCFNVLRERSADIPASVLPRSQEFNLKLSQLAVLRAQIDQLGDSNNPPQTLFGILGDAVEHLPLESFDVSALHAVRTGQPSRAHAARRFLEQMHFSKLNPSAAAELEMASAELVERVQLFQSNALFELRGYGFVLGLKLALNDSGHIETYAEAAQEMRNQAELVLHLLGCSGARWELEWPVRFGGDSIGLAVYVAALVARGELAPDPLLAATGRIDVNGRVCGVTAVAQKLRAAKESGIRRVLLPQENRPDTEKREEANGLDLIFVERIGEIRNRLLNAVAKAEYGYDGLIRAVRNLVPLRGLEVSDEKPYELFYRLHVGDASGIVPIDVFKNGNVQVGGSGSARAAADQVKEMALVGKPEARPSLTRVIPTATRRDNLRQLVADLGAEELPATNQYEAWRYRLVRGQSQATIILYTSGKCHLPSGQAPAYDALLECLEKATSGLGGVSRPAEVAGMADLDDPQIDETQPYIGTDEAGKGDFFGPLVSAAVYVDPRTAETLRTLGVKDSKLLSDKAVRRLAMEIRRVAGAKSAVTPIHPRKYNDLYQQMRSEGKNLNTLLAWGHARSIDDLILRGLRPKFAVVDKFADARYLEKKILADTRQSGFPIIQVTKAESHIAVAAASILARDSFLEWLEQHSARVGQTLPKGASEQVIEAARLLAGRLGPEALRDYAKVNFKTMEKVLAK